MTGSAELCTSHGPLLKEHMFEMRARIPSRSECPLCKLTLHCNERGVQSCATRAPRDGSPPRVLRHATGRSLIRGGPTVVLVGVYPVYDGVGTAVRKPCTVPVRQC